MSLLGITGSLRRAPWIFGAVLLLGVFLTWQGTRARRRARQAPLSGGEYLQGLPYVPDWLHLLVLPVEAIMLGLAVRDLAAGRAGRLQRAYAAGALFGSGLAMLVLGGIGLPLLLLP
jgi:hypothetical protein